MIEPVRISIPTDWVDRPVSISVVGAGGTGSQVVDQLASLHATLVALGHPGFHVTVFDGDCVSESNIGRQRFCRADIGRPKSDVLIHRINLFHGLSWSSVPEMVANGSQLSRSLVIGCSDTVAAREILHHCQACWWLDCGNNDRSGHVILGQPPRFATSEHAFRLPTWWDLFPGSQDEDTAPSCSVAEAIARQSWPVNHRAAQLACELLYCWFRRGFLDWHGALFTVDPPSVSVLNISPDTWWPFGLEVDREHVAALADRAN
jgi:PRTRC genetic system ThiF family protein